MGANAHQTEPKTAKYCSRLMGSNSQNESEPPDDDFAFEPSLFINEAQ